MEPWRPATLSIRAPHWRRSVAAPARLPAQLGVTPGPDAPPNPTPRDRTAHGRPRRGLFVWFVGGAVL